MAVLETWVISSVRQPRVNHLGIKMIRFLMITASSTISAELDASRIITSKGNREGKANGDNNSREKAAIISDCSFRHIIF